MAVVVSLPVVVLAAEEAEKTSSDQITTVLVDLRREKSTFERFLKTQFSPRLSQIRKSMKTNVEQATGLLKQLEKNPDSKRLAAAYEDTLSKALTQISTFLKEFQLSEGETFKALKRVEATVKKARETYRQAAEDGEKEAKEYIERARKAQDRLKVMAKEIGPLLKSGQKLSPELNAAVKELAIDKKISLLTQKVCEKAAENARHSVRILDGQVLVLRQVRGDLRVAFAQAGGQRMLVSKLAVLRKQGLLSREMADNLRAVQKITAIRGADMTNIVGALERVVAQSLSVTNVPGSKDEEVRLDQSGEKILLQLMAEMQDEEKNEEKKNEKNEEHE